MDKVKSWFFVHVRHQPRGIQCIYIAPAHVRYLQLGKQQFFIKPDISSLYPPQPGHLAFFTIEAIMRRPVSIRGREVAQQIGLFLLVCLMLYAFRNDILNVWPK